MSEDNIVEIVKGKENNNNIGKKLRAQFNPFIVAEKVEQQVKAYKAEKQERPLNVQIG